LQFDLDTKGDLGSFVKLFKLGQEAGMNTEHVIKILRLADDDLLHTSSPQVLHLSIIRRVFVGLTVAIELQNRQYTIRSHWSIRDSFL
jgi:hypothetical protein